MTTQTSLVFPLILLRYVRLRCREYEDTTLCTIEAEGWPSSPRTYVSNIATMQQAAPDLHQRPVNLPWPRILHTIPPPSATYLPRM